QGTSLWPGSRSWYWIVTRKSCRRGPIRRRSQYIPRWQLRTNLVSLLARNTLSVFTGIVTNRVDDYSFFIQPANGPIIRRLITMPIDTISEDHNCLATLDGPECVQGH